MSADQAIGVDDGSPGECPLDADRDAVHFWAEQSNGGPMIADLEQRIVRIDDTCSEEGFDASIHYDGGRSGFADVLAESIRSMADRMIADGIMKADESLEAATSILLTSLTAYNLQNSERDQYFARLGDPNLVQLIRGILASEDLHGMLKRFSELQEGVVREIAEAGWDCGMQRFSVIYARVQKARQ